MYLDRRRLGAFGEETAAGDYRSLGYLVSAANYHSPFGEIDLIVSRGACLVFVEVRTRDTRASVTPAETVDAGKQRRIILTARHFLSGHPELAGMDMRFDVFEVFYEGGYRCRTHRIENAFTL